MLILRFNKGWLWLKYRRYGAWTAARSSKKRLTRWLIATVFSDLNWRFSYSVCRGQSHWWFRSCRFYKSPTGVTVTLLRTLLCVVLRVVCLDIVCNWRNIIFICLLKCTYVVVSCHHNTIAQIASMRLWKTPLSAVHTINAVHYYTLSWLWLWRSHHHRHVAHTAIPIIYSTQKHYFIYLFLCKYFIFYKF